MIVLPLRHEVLDFIILSMIENIVIQLIVYVGSFYLLINLFAFLISDGIIFHPQPPGYTHLRNEITIPIGQNESITAVYLEHPEAVHTILFSHGNAEDLSSVVPFMDRFYQLGYSVLMYDYRGYGNRVRGSV